MRHAPGNRYQSSAQDPGRRNRRAGSRRGKRRGVAGPVLATVATLALVTGAGWYGTRELNSAMATGQDEPLTTLTDDASSPAGETPRTTHPRTASPSTTPSSVSPKSTQTRKPTMTPSRSSTAPSRGRTRPSPAPARSSTSTTQPTTAAAPSGSQEAQVLQLTNNERRKAGCGPLRTNAALTRAADAHASDMVSNHYFDHNSQDGRNPFDRMRAAGFSGGSMAENIAVGYTTAAAVVTGWMNSEGHRRNILNCDYTMIGIGYDAGQVKPEWGNGSWVQDFGG